MIMLAGVGLSHAQLGISLRPRGCDWEVVYLVAIFIVGCTLMISAMSLLRLRDGETNLRLDTTYLPFALPLPLLLLILTTSSGAGCSSTRDVANVWLLGTALTGASGLVLCGIATALVAAALSSCLSLQKPSNSTPETSRLSMVDQAIVDNEAFEADPTTHRFRGVE